MASELSFPLPFLLVFFSDAAHPSPFVNHTGDPARQEPTRSEVSFDHRKGTFPGMPTTGVLLLGLIAGHLFGVRQPLGFMLFVADLKRLRLTAEAT